MTTLSRRQLTMFAASAALAAACKKGGSSAEGEGGPLPVVRESSEGLVLTYIDEHGDFHVVDKPSDVPQAAKETVRVTDPSRDEGATGDTVFVADLRAARADGTFVVKRMKRSELEALALARRPTGAGPGSGPGASPAGNGAPAPAGAGTAGAPQVIIYGAEWCGPCHQAMAFLTQRGVPFVEKDIEKDPGAGREMQAKLARAGMRGGSIPVIDVKGTILVGFSAQAVEAALRR